MRRWGLDYPNLKKIKPDIIMVSNTGYGHGEGPYSAYPAHATTQEATHGQVSITGYPGELPSKAGASFVDFVACWAGLFATAAALRYRNRTGKGQWIDLGMYQLGCYFVSEYIMDWQANGRLGQRIGDRHPWRAPQGCYRCAGDDAWCAISVGDDDEWVALCGVMGNPGLASEPRFATGHDRLRYHDEIDEIITEWTKGVGKFEAMELLQAAGVPAGPVVNSKDMNLSEHYRATGFLEYVKFPEDRKVGTRVIMSRPWRGSKMPITIKGPGPKLGANNKEMLLKLLGRSEAQYQELEKADIIGDRPLNAMPVSDPSPEAMIRSGRAAFYDPDYKKNLGI
jgi:crotonobetainyl-CoA:carnitine CoA-transferase CaiB-like acyl-CoA transferase